MVNISENAKKELLSLLDSNPDTFIRVAVVGGGCSGLITNLFLDDFIEENDDSFLVEKIHFVLDKKSQKYLKNVLIDYTSTNFGKFKIIFPEGVRSCGCGSSFSMDDIGDLIKKECVTCKTM